jgi:hypothetical protein
MAAYIGKIEAFDETIEPWSSYVERLGQYFKANKVDDSLERCIIIKFNWWKNLQPPSYFNKSDKTCRKILSGDNQIAGRSFITKTVVNCRTI